MAMETPQIRPFEKESRVAEILVVDDKADTREALVAFLQLEGYTTRTAEDGLQALGKIMEHVPDLVLLDVNMPDMDGFEMLETIRRDPATTKIPVIMVTARNEAFEVARAFHLGATDYLVKPVQMEVLINRVQLQMRLGELEAQAREQNKKLHRFAETAKPILEHVQSNGPEPLREAAAELSTLIADLAQGAGGEAAP